jgi:predicted DNA-binding antitoxin AbrB/MazE fold protein
MTVKAIYEDGVLKPKGPLLLKEHEEVEIEVRPTSAASEEEQDPRSFVGFLKGGIKGMPVAAHHDKFLDQDQLAHLKAYLRGAMASPEWASLNRQEQLDRFVGACKTARPDLADLWEDMDRIPQSWSNAFEYCTRAIEREAVARHG